MKDKVVTKII